jgi:hypothetical protein
LIDELQSIEKNFDEDSPKFMIKKSKPRRLEEDPPMNITIGKLKLNETNLRRAWEVSNRSTKVNFGEISPKFLGRLDGMDEKILR